MKILLLVLLVSCQTQSQRTSPLIKVGQELNQFREAQSQVVKTVKKVDFNVFKNTCMPVGQRIKKLKESKKINVRQVSHKNRNPQNTVPESFAKYYEEFLKDSNQQDKMVVVNKIDYALVRIPVQETCLACHGDQKSKPDFIKKKYPKDLAHSFKTGDLRGIYIISQE